MTNTDPLKEALAWADNEQNHWEEHRVHAKTLAAAVRSRDSLLKTAESEIDRILAATKTGRTL